MKRLFWILALGVSIALVGCNRAELEQIATLQATVDSLNAQSAEKDKTINEFFESLNQIEQNLALIRQKEQKIGSEVKNAKQEELQADDRERISQDIIAINDIMAQNRNTIASMGKKLRQSNLKVTEFEKLLSFIP